MSTPRAIEIVEVGPRDGLQNEAAPVPTADKIAFGFERTHACLVHPCDEFFDFVHHFRTDAVTGEKKKLLRRHVAPF